MLPLKECGWKLRLKSGRKENNMPYLKKNQNGYPLTKRGDLMHRKVAENKVGRKLRDDEVVHHQDGDKTNFRKKNLSVMSRSFHSTLESKMRKKKGLFW